MRIVTPASKLFLKAEDSKNICMASNSLELRPELDIPSRQWQEYSHCHISNPEFDVNMKWSSDTRANLEQVLTRNSVVPPTLSFHLARDYEDASMNHIGRYVPSGGKLAREEMLQNVTDNACWAREHFGSQVLIENNNYYETGAYDTVTSPDFISDAIGVGNVGFLFDFAHAIVSAHNLGTDLMHYVDALPLEQTKQIHVSTPQLRNGEMVDTHDLPDVNMIREVLAMVNERTSEIPVVTVEYYKDAKQLSELLRSLRLTENSE